MNAARRLAVALVAAGAGLSGCSVELEHGLGERQANEVVAVLDRAGIAADKVADEAPGGFKVVVAQVGPLRVARGSRGLALGLAIGALALVFALSLALVAGAFRMRALRIRLRERKD